MSLHLNIYILTDFDGGARGLNASGSWVLYSADGIHPGAGPRWERVAARSFMVWDGPPYSVNAELCALESGILALHNLS